MPSAYHSLLPQVFPLGDFLSEEMAIRGMTAEMVLAGCLPTLTRERVREVLKGGMASEQECHSLACAFGCPPSLLINLQEAYLIRGVMTV